MSLPENPTVRCVGHTLPELHQHFKWSVIEEPPDSHLDCLIGRDSVQFSCSVVSDSWPRYGLQHARPPCPSPTPGVYSNSCPLSRRCRPTISSSVVPSPPAFNLPSIRVFSNESLLRIRWPKYWNFSFSIGPSSEYSELISFRMDWLDILAVQGTLKGLFKSTSSLVINFLYRDRDCAWLIKGSWRIR